MKLKIASEKKKQSRRIGTIWESARNYLNIFYLKSGIHGFFYFAYGLLHFVERLRNWYIQNK